MTTHFRYFERNYLSMFKLQSSIREAVINLDEGEDWEDFVKEVRSQPPMPEDQLEELSFTT